MTNEKLKVKGIKVRIDKDGFVCITDMVKGAGGTPNDYIKNWLQNISTIRFLEAWEEIHNSSFKTVESHRIRMEYGNGRFIMSTDKWIRKTGAIGIRATAGRYGGTTPEKF